MAKGKARGAGMDAGGAGGAGPGPGPAVATVAGLAERFRVNPYRLEEWGVFDLASKGGVGIRYRGTDGALLFDRRRTQLVATGHTFQPKGRPLAPYGLWKWHMAASAGWVLLVEGESDCWACWAADLPCLGIPGADAAGCLPSDIWAPEIGTVYVWQEPDPAGARFAESARKTLRERGYVRSIRMVQAPAGIKDVADLRCADPGQFADALKRVLGGPALYPALVQTPSLPATPAEAPAPAVAPEPGAGAAPAKRSPRKRTKAVAEEGGAGREGVSRPAGPKRSPRKRTKAVAEEGNPQDDGATTVVLPHAAPLAPPAPPPAARVPLSGVVELTMPALPAPDDDPNFAPGNSVKPLYRLATALERRELRWFLEPWIPLGKLSAISGRFGSGKSTLGTHLIQRAVRAVVLPGAEEDAGDELADRLDVAGIDFAHVAVADTRDWSFPSDRDKLLSIVRQHKADLVWIDPVDGYLAEGSENDGEYVRPALEALAWVARHSGAAVVFVRHPGKDPRNIMPGSRQWSNVPRVILELIEDEAHPGTRIVRPYKRSRGKEAPATYYHLDGEGDRARTWRWGAPCAASLVDEIRGEPDALTRRKIDRAVDLVRGLLEEGPLESHIVLSAGLREGFGDRMMERAAQRGGVGFHRSGRGLKHRCWWFLPGRGEDQLPTSDS